MHSLPLDLDAVTVVSCEQPVAAPLATQHLADLGARVLKIERPGSADFARATTKLCMDCPVTSSG